MLAVLAFCRWHLEERPGVPWLYLFCAAFACAWHATTVPAVLAPLVWAFFDRLATRRGQSLPRLFGFGFLAGLLVTLPLAHALQFALQFLYLAAQHAHLVLELLHLDHEVRGDTSVRGLCECRSRERDGQREAGHHELVRRNERHRQREV